MGIDTGSFKTESREIGGMHVSCTQLPPRRAFRLAARLVKYLAPAIAAARGVSMEAKLEALTPALNAMMADIDVNDLDVVLGEVLAGTQVVYSGKSISLANDGAIDLVFAGKFGAMLQAMKFALEVNFGDFFAGLGVGESASTTTPTA